MSSNSLHSRKEWIAVGAVIGVLAVGTGGLLAAFTPSLAVFYGYPDLGVVVGAGLPAARIIALGASVVAVGNLLLAAVLAPGEPFGTVSPAGYQGLHRARIAAAVLAASAIVVAVLTIAETVGTAPGAFVVRPATFVAGIRAVEPAAGWAALAVIAAAASVAAGSILRWRSAVGLLTVLLIGLAAPPMTSVGNSEESHDWSGDSITLHTLAATLWLGSTLVLATRMPPDGNARRVMVRRHGLLAAACLVVVALSGIAPAALAVHPGQVLTTLYGLLLAVGLAAVVVLLVVGRHLRAAMTTRTRGAAARLAALELVLISAAATAGSAMTRLLPPAEEGEEATRLTFLLGYELPDHLTLADLVSRWRIDLIFGPLAIVAAVGYLWGVRRYRRSGRSWPGVRTVSWVAGCVVILVATSSGIGTYATGVFSVHMAAHMLLAVLAPVLLVLGHGLTLVLDLGGDRTRVRMRSLLDSPWVRFASHPGVALAVVATSLFGLYATGLFDVIVLDHWSHPVMDTAALGSGILVFWPLLGRSVPARALPGLGSLAVVFSVMVLHAGFSIWLLSRAQPVGRQFYAALQLPFLTDLLADQRRGAVAAWVIGELGLVLAVVTLLRRWSRPVEESSSSAIVFARSDLAPLGDSERETVKRPGEV